MGIHLNQLARRFGVFEGDEVGNGIEVAGTFPTPHTEAFQAVVWHLLVSHPTLKAVQSKCESTPSVAAPREIQANPALGMTHSQFELASRPDSSRSARLRAPEAGIAGGEPHGNVDSVGNMAARGPGIGVANDFACL